MAYTYDDFTAAANKAGLLGTFSQEDLTMAQSRPEYGLSMLKLQQDRNGATTTEQKLLAEEAINQLRNSYSGWTTPAATTEPAASGSFVYDQETAYQKLLNEVAGAQPFSYNVETDPRYISYKKSYLREGDRAIADTMAKASAASGGVPSSYAVTAAQQAGDYYNAKLNDIIPTLFNDAYDQHLRDFSSKITALGALEQDRAFDYNKHLQEWNNALTLYQMGQRTPEIAKILGIPYVAPAAAVYYDDSGYGGGGSGGTKTQSKVNSTIQQAQNLLAQLGGNVGSNSGRGTTAVNGRKDQVSYLS